MNQHNAEIIEDIYPVCRRVLAPDAWNRVQDICNRGRGAEEFPELLSHQADIPFLPGYLAELAQLEWTVNHVRNAENSSSPPVNQIAVNPALHLLRLSWKNLTCLLNAHDSESVSPPESGEEYVLVWRHPRSGEAAFCPATNEDLLVLKMVAEEIDVRKVAADGRVTIHKLDAAMDRAVRKGLLIAQPSGIRRDTSDFPKGEETEEDFLSASVFTLQWHITQACDLHCRHCYDRSERQAVEPVQAIAILDDLYEFCRSRHVKGQVSFSGGNPVLYPYFLEVYRAASERGFNVAVLGNPIPERLIQKLIAVESPVFYQVSLEGLPEHNDLIRGAGHFERVLEFLAVLRQHNVYSMVMLTLTNDNLAQVLPLAEALRDRTDLFTFNRLSLVGEGAKLQLPPKSDYTAFLEAYADAAENNPVIALKDNLINIIRHKKGLHPFGGCTGYGCGAAFNFMCVLADGSTHACRKFPSPIGNVLHTSLAELYDSEAARRYRAGCRTCRSCPVRPVCGGCLAIAYSLGLDVFEERDPYCFMSA